MRDGNVINMRLQMHATDPSTLEQRLGTRQSKGCIRTPSSLNVLLDRYGVLDAEYEQLAAATGRRPWVLPPDGEPVPEAGRYLVLVDSGLAARPAWSPQPSRAYPARAAASAQPSMPEGKKAPAGPGVACS